MHTRAHASSPRLPLHVVPPPPKTPAPAPTIAAQPGSSVEAATSRAPDVARGGGATGRGGGATGRGGLLAAIRGGGKGKKKKNRPRRAKKVR